MRKIIDYIILDSKYSFMLGAKVCREIDYGWQPIGGVGISGSWLKKVYVQAMVKYSEDGNG